MDLNMAPLTEWLFIYQDPFWVSPKFAMSTRLARMTTDFGLAIGISPWVCVVERRSASEENELTLRVDAKT
jgi:hypothetical protein